MARITRTQRVPDAARRLGLTTLELYRLIDLGLVPAVRTSTRRIEVATDLAVSVDVALEVLPADWV